VPLLTAPIAVLALVAPLTQRWAAGVVLLVVAALGIATAFAAVGVSIVFVQSEAVPIWPGTGLSLAWLGALGGALTALDSGLAPRLAVVRAATAAIVMLALAVLSIPALSAITRGVAQLQSGPVSTLPAFVAAEGRDDPDLGTIVLTPQNEEGVSSRLVWGASETLGSQTTLVSTRTREKPGDAALADVTADLVTSSAADAAAANWRRRASGSCSSPPRASPNRMPLARCGSRHARRSISVTGSSPSARPTRAPCGA
jgi:hypothetical protein